MATIGVNTSLALAKDRAFAILYSNGPPRPMPSATFASWLSRDIFGMSFVFTAPPFVADWIAGPLGVSHKRAEQIAQLTVPMIAQPFVSPFHLLGYLQYHEPHATWSHRLAQLQAQLPAVTAIRCIRGFPPYCLGAVANKSIRHELHGLDVSDTIPIILTGARP